MVKAPSLFAFVSTGQKRWPEIFLTIFAFLCCLLWAITLAGDLFSAKTILSISFFVEFVLTGLFSFVSLILLGELFWQLAGKEMMMVGPGSIIIQHQISGRIAFRRNLPYTGADLRVTLYENDRKAQLLRLFDFRSGRIEFRSGADAIHFGQFLDAPKAEQLLCQFNEQVSISWRKKRWEPNPKYPGLSWGDIRFFRYWLNLFLFATASLTLALVGVSPKLTWNYLHPWRLPFATEETPAYYGIPFQEITLHTSDGLELAAWYTPSRNGAVILVAHSYATHRLIEMHALFARHGYGVISWDFRAHGQSQGEITTLGYAESLDVEAALDYALALPEIGSHGIGAWGGSMGGAATIFAAARRPEIDVMVVDSSYAVLEEELKAALVFPILRPLVKFFAEQYTGIESAAVRPIDQMAAIDPRPILIIQGLGDQVVPPDSGQRLFDAAGDGREIWLVDGVRHLEIYHAYPEEYERRVIAFFDHTLLQGMNK
jgi:fermentation-respiration switch protein FrsA (DUF1100 family)